MVLITLIPQLNPFGEYIYQPNSIHNHFDPLSISYLHNPNNISMYIHIPRDDIYIDKERER